LSACLYNDSDQNGDLRQSRNHAQKFNTMAEYSFPASATGGDHGSYQTVFQLPVKELKQGLGFRV
jgi:hypothetical protein